MRKTVTVSGSPQFSPGIDGQLTEVEVVILGITNANEKDQGMNYG